jgi:hypothetical protein
MNYFFLLHQDNVCNLVLYSLSVYTNMRVNKPLTFQTTFTVPWRLWLQLPERLPNRSIQPSGCSVALGTLQEPNSDPETEHSVI